MRIVALIPAFNEQTTIVATVEAVFDIPGVSEVVVIDDGSWDETAFFAHDAGATVIQLEKRSGKGAALNRGIAETEAQIYMFLHADLGSSAKECAALLEPILADHADMSIGVMPSSGLRPGGMGFVLKLSGWAIRRYGGTIVTAPLSGQRAIRSQLLADIGDLEPGFAVETALTIDALRLGYRIVETNIDFQHRATGRDLKGFAHRGKQFWEIAKMVWRRRKDWAVNSR